VLGDLGKYDLWVYSTNGFVRTFKGNAVDTARRMGFKPEVEVTYDKHERKLNVKVRNTGHERGTVTVRKNAYSTGGPSHVDVKPGDVAAVNAGPWRSEPSSHPMEW